MSKDVVYIEPEDDITDIIAKIENSKERIVALVPPKKAAVMRSIVNMRLMAKAATGAGKTIVLVTTDPTIVKLAAATRLPVTKNLQTAPEVPSLEGENVAETVARETVVEAPDEEADVPETDASDENTSSPEGLEEASHTEEPVDTAEASETLREAVSAESEENDSDDGDETDEKAAEPEDDNRGEKKAAARKAATEADGKFPSKAWFKGHRKIVIGASAGVVGLILLFVWMFAIAPKATISLSVRTSQANFSENVTFTDKLQEEDSTSGKFYLIEQKAEAKTEVKFEATGKKNIGEKATGTVTIYSYFDPNETLGVDAGTTFTVSGLSFTSDKAVTMSWDGQSECDNDNDRQSLVMYGCRIVATVPVTAVAAGANYNLNVREGWTSTNPSIVVTRGATSGGTDAYVTVVQQSDVDKAKASLTAANESENKAKLIAAIDSDDALVIDSSYAQTVGDAVSVPGVGEEVKDGDRATLTIVTTDTIYYIDKTKVEEFIKEKAKLATNFKIYSMNDPFIENFLKTDNGWTGKLKTSYIAGPSVTENSVIELVAGKGTGSATHDLSGIDGIGSVTVETSYPWVTTIPSDPNRITVKIDFGNS